MGIYGCDGDDCDAGGGDGGVTRALEWRSHY